MAEQGTSVLVISSAVIRALPDHASEVIATINRFPDAEVFHSEAGKIVVVLEGPSTGAVGARLAEIALINGVISANFVYEHTEALESLEEHP